MSKSNNDSSTSTIRASVPVAIYTRVSTDGQVGHRFDSCEHQANVCRGFIGKNQHIGWFEVGHFSDEAYSGATLDRPGIRLLMQRIALGQIKIVLVYKFERIARRVLEWSRLQLFLREHGCQLLSPTEDHSDTTASGRLKLNMMMSFAEYERVNVAEKTRSKLRAQAMRGMWGGGYVPFGYAYDRACQRLIPNPDEAAILKEVFTRAAELVMLSDIAEGLNRAGLRSGVRWEKGSDGERRPVGGKPFRTDILRKLIQNSLYRGVIRYEGQEFSGQHEALVDAELWERANAAVAESKRKPKKVLRDRDKYSNLLKGMVICTQCGEPLFSKASGKDSADGPRYRYYFCTGIESKTLEGQRTCFLRSIPGQPLEDLVVGFLSRVGAKDETVSRFSQIAEVLIPTQKQLQAELRAIEERLAEIGVKVRNCVDTLENGGLEQLQPELKERISLLHAQRQPLIVEREACRQKLQALGSQLFDAERLQLSFERLGRMLPLMDRAKMRNLLSTILGRIEISTVEWSARFRAKIAGDRIFRLGFTVYLEQLVTAMERDVMIDDRTIRTSAYAHQELELETEIVIGRNGRALIITPFRAELGIRPSLPVPPEAPQHPIHRATAWERDIRTHGGVRAVADYREVSASLVSLHLKLLKLAPEIQIFLRDLAAPKALQFFSLRRMARLAELPHGKQLAEFNVLRSDFPKN